MRTANIMGIDRLRMGTDGQGITTLIAFYKCPLNCKFCLNPKCHTIHLNSKVSSIDLYNNIKIDQLYFAATGGGLTFGGGEPLLHASFIHEVLELGAKDWHTTIETSLNIPYKKWCRLIDYIDEYIVDVKDMNQSIYKSYTGSDNKIAINNLIELQQLGHSNKVLIRLPFIPGFNGENDILKSRETLEELGFTKFDIFKYKVV